MLPIQPLPFPGIHASADSGSAKRARKNVLPQAFLIFDASRSEKLLCGIMGLKSVHALEVRLETERQFYNLVALSGSLDEQDHRFGPIQKPRACTVALHHSRPSNLLQVPPNLFNP